jgi:Type VI secretion system (T6SS), amidase immunity protein
MNIFRAAIACWLIFGRVGWCAAAPMGADISEASTRTYAQNFKDAMLAACIAQIADKNSKLQRDANSTARGLLELSLYDAEKGLGEVDRLTEKYLARDYRDPIIENKNEGVRFDLAKCFDMYHSKALAAQVKRLVIKPTHTHARDYPQTR